MSTALSDDCAFVFLNFPADQAESLHNLENIRLIQATNDPLFKCKFGQTMDLFLHPRLIGKTFGLAIAEVRTC